MLELRREATEPRFGYSANSGESSEVLILHQSSTDGCTSFLPVGLRMEPLGHHQEVDRKSSRPPPTDIAGDPQTASSRMVLSRCWCATGGPRHLPEPLGTGEGSMRGVIPSRPGLCREVEASRRRQIHPVLKQQ